MDEITIESMIEALRKQDTGEVCDALAEKCLKMFMEAQGRFDLTSSIVSRIENENRELKSQNGRLISIAYSMSRKI